MSSSIMQYLLQLSQQQQPPRSAPQNPIPSALPPQPPTPRPNVRGTAPGILSRFGETVRNTLAPNPGEQVQGLIGADAIKAAQSQALLSLGASLLSNSGWQERPVTLGEALGKGLQASQQTYGQSLNTAVDNATNARNAQSWEEQRRAAATASTELAQQRATERAQNEAIARARPGYAKYNAGWDTLTEEQKTGRYEAWLNEAAQIGDEPTVQRIQGLLVARQQMAGKGPGNQQYVMGGDGQQYRVERQPDGSVKEVPVGNRRPVSAGGGRGGVGGPTDNLKIPTGWTTSFNGFNNDGVKIAASGERLSELESRLATTQSGVQQYDLIFQFLKSRDNSVVRESEIAGLSSTDPVVKKIARYLSGQKYVNGQLLDPGTANTLLQIMRGEYESDKRAASVRADAVSRALAPRVTGYNFDAVRAQYGLLPLGAPAASTDTTAPAATTAAPAPRKKFTTYNP